MTRYIFLLSISLSLLLSSCYNSPSDLIGDHANVIKSFDGLIISNGRVFYVTPNGKQALLCEISIKADLKKECSEGIVMKMERLYSGNYIIQIQEHKTDNFKYALWLRSEPSPGSALSTCVVWLGEGIVGLSNTTPFSYKYENSQALQEFSNSVRKISKDAIINRDQLLKIAQLYEFQAFNSGGDWSCLNERTRISGNLIEIEGDSRNKQSFEPPKT